MILNSKSPRSAARLYVAICRSPTDAAIDAVIPKLCAKSCAKYKPLSYSPSLSLGMIDLTIFIADGSRSVPLGSPVRGSFSMMPFSGLGVSLEIPAISSAFELATPLCPSSAST